MLLVILILLLFFPVANAQETSAMSLNIKAEVFYLPRLALPQEAELLLTLNDFSDSPRLLLKQRRPLSGKQVPIDFTWTIALDALPTVATFQAAIINNNKIIWMSESLPVVLMPGEQNFGALKLTAVSLPLLNIKLYCGNSRLHFTSQAGEQQLALSSENALSATPLLPLPNAQGQRFLLGDKLEFTEENGKFFLKNAKASLPCLDRSQLPALSFEIPEGKVALFEENFLLSLDQAALYLSPIQSIQQNAASLFFRSELFDLWYEQEPCPKQGAWRQSARLSLQFKNTDLAEKISAVRALCYGEWYPHGRWQVTNLPQASAESPLTLSFLEQNALSTSLCPALALPFSLEKGKISFAQELRQLGECSPLARQEAETLLQKLRQANRLIRNGNNQLELWAGESLLLQAISQAVNE
jgi:uncharacterized lipoprotein YbaY